MAKRTSIRSVGRKFPSRVKMGTQVKTIVGPLAEAAAIKGHVTARLKKGINRKKHI